MPFHISYFTFCLYRPPPSSKHGFKDSSFIEEFSVLLTFCNTLKGSYVICGNFNFHYLPQTFSDFFANKIYTIRHTLDTDSTSLPTCNGPQFLGHPLSAFHPVSEASVKNIIRQPDIKTCELDPLSAFFFKQCLDTLHPYITTIVNNSLMSGSFP